MALVVGTSLIVWYAVLGICVSMALGTLVRLLALRGAAAEFRANRLASLRSWWMIVLLFSAAMLLDRIGVVLFFALVSWLAVREYMALTKIDYREFCLTPIVWLLIPANYLLILLGQRDVFVVFVPIVGLMLIATRMVVRERADGFLLAASSLQWGLMLTVYFLSHAALLLTLPEENNPKAGNAGWLLYLLVLTSTSDISQALIGRRWGKRPVAPVLSPHKTQLGLFGGAVVTVLLAVALAPVLTPLGNTRLPWLGVFGDAPMLAAVLAGLLISVSGYFGDITISGVKRDVKVKDSGTLLPGQGGILDRIDSLMFTAPLFYYYVVLVHGA